MGEVKENINLDSLDISKDIIEPINKKTVKTKELAIQLNVTEKALKSHIKANGYIWLGSKYIKETKPGKKLKAPVNKEVATEKVKVTYKIEKELYKLVKLQAIIEDTDNTDIIEKAIRSYVSDKAKGMLKQI